MQGLQQRRFTGTGAGVAEGAKCYNEEGDQRYKELMEGAYGKSNRPQTPMRTVLNGVYGAVASFEIVNKLEGIESKRQVDLSLKPSRKHTRATTLAQESVLRNTLDA